MADPTPLFRVSMAPSAGQLVANVLASGYIGQGSKVEEFERALEPWMGSIPVTVNSATSGLTLAMKLAGVGPGASVITTPLTCSATNLPILHLGGTPIWADIDPRTGLIDPASVEALVRRHRDTVKAIVAVDWGGAPCDYRELAHVADGLPIIADAAHSFGAWYGEDPVGNLADYTVFSFQAIKHLTTGDGGAVVVPDEQRKRARDLRWFGIDRDLPGVEFRGALDITEAGYKWHMNDINAQIGLANLTIVHRVLAAHRTNAALYDEQLDPRFVRTSPAYEHQSSWWMYTTLLPSAVARDAFRLWMAERGVTVSQVHWRNDKLSVFASYQRELPGVDDFSSKMICLPTHSGAKGWRVLAAANEFFEGPAWSHS